MTKQTVLNYHKRTKHSLERYAKAPISSTVSLIYNSYDDCVVIPEILVWRNRKTG
ncbi:MAG: hypothetical protein Q7U38_03400 [Methylobacter sp.]|nr:hypothetical protein [Methylobacter sp.]MDP2097157.1 hypothetical protein [Methylobacter sp.]MDP2429568.1 hypothetical protein [Methylobacter sp.]MDP3054145.1 hypothetical protein [Methylobacter sp.]MDP3361232.1 hypothetical protein [Methylobacter sp.]